MADVESSIVGQPSTGGLGTAVAGMGVRLRSRKTTSSTITWALSGSSSASGHGSLVPSRARPLTTSAITSGKGQVVGSVSGTQAAFLVDEVATDALLSGHPDVIWKPSYTALTTSLLPNDWFLPNNGQQFPTAFWHDNTSVQQEAHLKNEWSVRFHGGYSPDHAISLNTYVNGHAIYVSSDIGDGQSMMHGGKFFGTYNKPSAATAMGSTPITEAWYRWNIYLESSFRDYFTEPSGFKLHQFIFGTLSAQGRGSLTSWLRRPDVGARRFQLGTYWSGGDLPSFYQGANFLPYYMYVGTWHTFELRIKMNTPGVANGVRQFWFDDQLIVDHQNVIVHSSSNSNDLQLEQVTLQMFHGGPTPGPTFSAEGWARLAGHVTARRRVGAMKTDPVIELDLNSNSWASTWSDPAQRTNMEYSNAYQLSSGRHVEFSIAQHDRPAGDNVGVRWADFTTDQPPTGGYYTSNTDLNISETDNMPSAYLPWVDAAWLGGNSNAQPVRTGHKIIQNISTTPTFLFRNNDGGATNFHTDFHELDLGTGITSDYYLANYNPACLVNPESNATWTCFIGGGVEGNFPNSRDPSVKVIKRNPNYPATSTKPFILKVFKVAGPVPLHMRHAVRIGSWIYWGGGGQHTGTTHDSQVNNHQFYRVYAPDLPNGVYTQEAITPATQIVASHGLPLGNCVRFNLLCADDVRKWLIYINIDGVYRYKVPSNDGANGTWDGPYTFGYSDWANTISEGNIAVNWHGVIGTHRADLRQTFFRYNLSKKWNRIKWGIR